MVLDEDAFSSGQITSKMWLVDVLAGIDRNIGTMWVLGGWYAILPFLFMTSGRFSIDKIRSFDIDAKACSRADSINETWLSDGFRFKSINADANGLDYDRPGTYGTGDPDLIINTSSEHFGSKEWFHRIPDGRMVVIQNNDMYGIPGHVSCCQTIEELTERYPMSDVMFSGSLPLVMNGVGYNRFMLIGTK